MWALFFFCGGGVVKRPSFQFYPADWRNNAKLRRCSWEARGVWIELLGLLHDSDDYGILRWPLKEIAQALGAPLKALKELVDKGVLYGAEKGACEPMVYVPVSARQKGAPVELVPAQEGPIWYSPRMVRDEYKRGNSGGSTRFKVGTPDDTPPGGDDAPSQRRSDSPSRAPEPSLSASPSRRHGEGQSDGSTSSSSSSSSPSVASATSGGAADARRRRFEMHEDWQPDEVSLRYYLRTSGVPLEALTPALIAEFVGYWLGRPDEDTHLHWCQRLVKHAARQQANKPTPAGVSHDATKTRGGAASGRISLAENIADRSWADGLEPY